MHDDGWVSSVLSINVNGDLVDFRTLGSDKQLRLVLVKSKSSDAVEDRSISLVSQSEAEDLGEVIGLQDVDLTISATSEDVLSSHMDGIKRSIMEFDSLADVLSLPDVELSSDGT